MPVWRRAAAIGKGESVVLPSGTGQTAWVGPDESALLPRCRLLAGGEEVGIRCGHGPSAHKVGYALPSTRSRDVRPGRVVLDDDGTGGGQVTPKAPGHERQVQPVHVDDIGSRGSHCVHEGSRRHAGGSADAGSDAAEAVLHAVPGDERVPVKPLDDGCLDAGRDRRVGPAGQRLVAGDACLLVREVVVQVPSDEGHAHGSPYAAPGVLDMGGRELTARYDERTCESGSW
jgi:hypothetical protein